MENIIIYETKDGKTVIDIKLEQDTIWLTQAQIGQIFDVQKAAVSKHLKNIFATGELQEDSVVSILETTARDDRKYKTFHYNLDAILSVGYRVNSKNATQFRIWATQTLKAYLTKGYVMNEKRLAERDVELKAIKEAIALIDRGMKNQVTDLIHAKQLAEVLLDFSKGLSLLDDYDNEKLDKKGKTPKPAKKIELQEFLEVINKMKPVFASDVFAVPKDQSFESSVKQIYQSLGNTDCYPTLEEKAAMLLYLITKNHSFLDGNKRIAASCFLYFLNENNLLYGKKGKKIIDDDTLFALTLLIAESQSNEMETIKRIVMSILNRNKK